MSDEARKENHKRKRRKSRSKEPVYGSYVIAIEDWDWALSFGIDQTRYRKSPYMDCRHLHLRGRFVVPSRIKVETAQAILMPERIPNERDAPESKGVGSASVFRDRFEALLGMPDDALAPVLQNADREQVLVHRLARGAHALSSRDNQELPTRNGHRRRGYARLVSPPLACRTR